MKTIQDQAIGSWEAAQVMGVHFTQPSVMSRAGKLTAKVIKSLSGEREREFVVYSLADANADWDDYVAAIDRGERRRRRVHADARPDELRRLKRLQAQIAFDNAVGASEAADIMGCHWTWPPRMAVRGDIVGRILHNGRDGKAGSRLWIFSRRSCLENVAKAKAEIAAGTKIGRPRRATRK